MFFSNHTYKLNQCLRLLNLPVFPGSLKYPPLRCLSELDCSCLVEPHKDESAAPLKIGALPRKLGAWQPLVVARERWAVNEIVFVIVFCEWLQQRKPLDSRVLTRAV